MDDLGDLNTLPAMKTVPGVTVQDAVVENITQEIHYHTAPGREWCVSCDREVLKGERAYRCPRCGSAPHHEECCDKEVNCCPKCAREFRIEEQQRVASPRLMLDIQREGQTDTTLPSRIFVFVRRTVQIGRAKAPDAPRCQSNGKLHYQPRSNDIISRVVATLEDSRRAVHADCSRLISRSHGVLRIHRGARGEELRYLDCGNNGGGSSHGSWTGNSKLAHAQWHILENGEKIRLGYDPASGREGFVIEPAIHRSPSDPTAIAAVTIRRCDALSREHMYVMVGREATVGGGPNICIPIRSGSPRLDGIITCQRGQLFLDLTPGAGLKPEGDGSGSEGMLLCPGLILRGEEISIHVQEATDQDFCTYL